MDPAIDQLVKAIKNGAVPHNLESLVVDFKQEKSSFKETAADLAELAARHPAASFIAAHVGGDWERGIRAIRSAENVTAEISGSDPTAGVVEMAVRELGAERVMYGSDFAGRSFASQLAKVYGADISEADKRLILGENLQRMLQPILAAKGKVSQ